MRSEDEHSKWQEKERQRSHPSHGHAHRREHAVAGEIGHWVRTAGILAPLLIGEFVKDPERKWRFIRVTSVAAAILSEGLHSHKGRRDHERYGQVLEACAAPGSLTSVS
jgi:hypothetical protein